MVICLRVLAVDLVASCFFTELFFPLGALWRFSVVSPARHAFGCSRFSENEISLFFSFFFLPLHVQSRVFRLVLRCFCLPVSDRVRQTGVRTSTAPVEEHRVCIYI